MTHIEYWDREEYTPKHSRKSKVASDSFNVRDRTDEFRATKKYKAPKGQFLEIRYFKGSSRR